MQKQFIYICPTCGVEFFSRRPHNTSKSPTYCSKVCYVNRIKHIPIQYKITCKHCGIEFISARQDAQFCSPQCLGEWRRAGEYRICKHCGNSFYIRVSHNDQFCNRKCYEEYRIKNTIRVCKTCGKEFRMTIRLRNINYCSRTCWLTRKPNGIMKTCPNCKKEFYVCKAHINNQFFCSRKCRLIYKGPSSIEILLANELDARNINYETQFKIGGYFIDFAFPFHKLAVEADGSYWHSLPENKKRDGQKDKFLKKNGWKIIRFSEIEINQSASLCIDKVVSILKLEW